MNNNDRSSLVSIAIVPARGGSKGVPGKNLRLLGGNPLLWYTVKASLASKMISCTIVSTEDQEIANYAQSLGVNVLRHPIELSSDTSPTYPVVRWAMREWLRRGNKLDVCVVLRATTPLRSSADIDGAVNLLAENINFADSVVSVRPAVGIHPIRLKRILPDGCLVDAFEPEGSSPKRRQELEVLYLRNGGIYASKRNVIEATGLWGSVCLAYVMPEERSVNINTEFDFEVADLLVRRQLKSYS
jgi:CMP-N-acetylneuraminic acid synthetase